LVRRFVPLLLALVSPAAWAHGGSDWMFAVTASYSAVLLGAACGLGAAWKAWLTLWRLLPVYALGLLALAFWLGTLDWPWVLGLVAIACVLISGAFVATRKVGRLLRSRRGSD